MSSGNINAVISAVLVSPVVADMVMVRYKYSYDLLGSISCEIEHNHS